MTLTLAPTHHDAAFREQQEREPEAAARVLALGRKMLKRGTVDYLPAIGQPFAGAWSDGDFLALGRVHGSIVRGEYAVVRVEVGSAPGPDAARDENARALADAAPPFVLKLNMEQNNSHHGDGDGWWTAPITLTRRTLRAAGTLQAGEVTVGAHPDRALPLEVGSTRASTTDMHMNLYGGLFRWPYRSTDAWLILDLARFRDPDAPFVFVNGRIGL